MKLARVVGNVVSTVKDAGYYGQKLMIIDYLDDDGKMTGNQAIAFDVADAGVGDTVIVNVDGGLNSHTTTVAQFRAMASRTW